MSTAATVIPTFAAVTLLLGGFNEISAKLTLVGILGILVHAAITPTDLLGPYPNFDSYHPTQPPLRDYVLVFGLANIVLVILFSRIYPLLRSLAHATRKAHLQCLRSCGLLVRQPNIPPGQSAPKVQDTIADHDSHPIPRIPQSHHSPSSPSSSHALTDQWTATASTLATESPTPITFRTTGCQEVTDSSETAALKLRVSQLEVALEEMRRRVDALTPGGQGMDTVPGIAPTVVTKSPPVNLNMIPPPTTQSSSPSPPIDQSSTLLTADATTGACDRLRSIVEFITEETRQTDRFILKMRNILAETGMTDDTTFEPCNGEGDMHPVSPTPRSTQSLLRERPYATTRTALSPYPSPSPSPSMIPPDQPLRTPKTRRVASPLPSAASQIEGTAEGSPGTPGFNLSLDLSDLSEAPCSTPLRLANGVRQPTTPSSSSDFLDVLEADFGPQDTFASPAFKRIEKGKGKAYPAGRAASRPTRITPLDSTPRSPRDFLSRLRERSMKLSYPPPPRNMTGLPLDPQRNGKEKVRTVRTLVGMSDWLAERRRRRKTPP